MHDSYNFRYYIDIIFKIVYNNVISTDEQNNMKCLENPDSLMSKCKMTKWFFFFYFEYFFKIIFKIIMCIRSKNFTCILRASWHPKWGVTFVYKYSQTCLRDIVTKRSIIIWPSHFLMFNQKLMLRMFICGTINSIQSRKDKAKNSSANWI